jgi:predicted nucleic acid-binding protein
VADADVRAQTGREAVEALLAEAETVLAVSEVTVLEYSSTLTQYWRMNEKPSHDQAWAERSLEALMRRIASGRIAIVPIPLKAGEHAMQLMTVATRDRGIALHTWDAVHLITATAWADTLGQQVELVTCDDDYKRFVTAFPYFGEFVTITEVV